MVVAREILCSIKRIDERIPTYLKLKERGSALDMYGNALGQVNDC